MRGCAGPGLLGSIACGIVGFDAKVVGCPRLEVVGAETVAGHISKLLAIAVDAVSLDADVVSAAAPLQRN